MTYGQSARERGLALRHPLIDAAGRDVVEVSYDKRMVMGAERLKTTVATRQHGVRQGGVAA